MRLITPPLPAEFCAFEDHHNLFFVVDGPVLQLDQFGLKCKQGPKIVDAGTVLGGCAFR